MMGSIVRSSFVVLALAIAACASESRATETVEAQSQALQGASADGESTFVVALFNERFRRFCTAVLIAPNLALSTRHCIDDAPSGWDCNVKFEDLAADRDMQVSTCADARNPTSCSWVRSTRIIRPEHNSICGADIALIVLERNFEDPLPYVDLRPVPADAVGAPFRVVAYGSIDPQVRGWGVRRALDSLQLSCVGASCQSSAFNTFVADTEFASESAGVCEGDSGGPALILGDEGRPVVFGAVVRAGSLASECVGSIYVRLDAYRDLIVGTAREAASAGAYPVPSWAEAPRELGAGCDLGLDCASGHCASTQGKGKVCVQPCSSNEVCGSGGVCRDGTCAPVTTSAPPKRGSECSIGPSSVRNWPWLLAFSASGLVLLARRRTRMRRE